MDKLSRREDSPILRAFSGAVFDIGQFSPEETRQALEAPLEEFNATGRWETEAVRVLHHLTHGYPYLVQCFAAAAYRDGRRLGEVDVREAIPGGAAARFELARPRANGGLRRRCPGVRQDRGVGQS